MNKEQTKKVKKYNTYYKPNDLVVYEKINRNFQAGLKYFVGSKETYHGIVIETRPFHIESTDYLVFVHFKEQSQLENLGIKNNSPNLRKASLLERKLKRDLFPQKINEFKLK